MKDAILIGLGALAGALFTCIWWRVRADRKGGRLP